MFLKNKILSMCVLLAFIVQIVALGGLTGGIVYAGGAVFINESFNIPLGETLPAGWSLLTGASTNNGDGSNTIVEKPLGSAGDHALQILDNDNKVYGVFAALGEQTESITVEFDFLFEDVPGATGSVFVALKDEATRTSDTDGVVVQFNKEQIMPKRGTGSGNYATDLLSDWVSLKIVADPKTQKYNMYLGDECIADDYAFKASLDTFSHFVIYTALGASSTCYFDNVKIYKTKAPSPVEIVSLEFTDELEGVGNPIDTLAGAEAVWASLTAKNYLPIEQKVACIMALYNAANKVQIVQVQEKYADAGSEIPFEMGFGLPTDDDLTGYFVKVFLWDGIQSMIPFVKPQEVPKSDN